MAESLNPLGVERHGPTGPPGPRDLWRGLIVFWLHKPRGGYGFTIRLECTVVSAATKHALVDVKLRNGTAVRRWVPIASLRETSPRHRHALKVQEDADAR